VTVVESAKVPAGGRGSPFQVRGSLQTLLSLRLSRPDDPDFFTLLLDKIAHSPEFFREAPIVLDVGPIAERPPIDLAAFTEKLRRHRLVAVGVQNGSAAWNAAAREAGLALLGAGGAAAQRPAQATSAPQPARRGAALVVTEPVRSGQQVLAPDGDLVILAQVGNGAEVAAAGHVHVYGPLRGRAFAGIEGDERAMIFCDALFAELLSIAGVYLVNEALDKDTLGRRARVASAGERLYVTTVS
jgi:septum site-determining protein MinC